MDEAQFNNSIEKEKMRREKYYQELSLLSGRSKEYIRGRMREVKKDVPVFKKNTSINAWCIFRSEDASRRKTEAGKWITIIELKRMFSKSTVDENKAKYEGLKSSAARRIYEALPVEKKLELRETAAREAAAASHYINETDGYVNNIVRAMKSLKDLNCDGIFLATYPSKEDPSQGRVSYFCTGDAKPVFRPKLQSMKDDFIKYRFPATTTTLEKRK